MVAAEADVVVEIELPLHSVVMQTQERKELVDEGKVLLARSKPVTALTMPVQGDDTLAANLHPAVAMVDAARKLPDCSLLMRFQVGKVPGVSAFVGEGV